MSFDISRTLRSSPPSALTRSFETWLLLKHGGALLLCFKHTATVDRTEYMGVSMRGCFWCLCPLLAPIYMFVFWLVGVSSLGCLLLLCVSVCSGKKQWVFVFEVVACGCPTQSSTQWARAAAAFPPAGLSRIYSSLTRLRPEPCLILRGAHY